MTNNSKEKLPRKRRNDKHFITFKYRVASKKKEKRKIIRKKERKFIFSRKTSSNAQ